MRIYVLLNGSNLRRWSPQLPDQLLAAARERGLEPEIAVSKSVEQVDHMIGKAVETGFDTIMSCGGDGTLHHLLNHPMAPRVAISMLPAGTINAFLRAEGVDVRRPVEAFRQLLAGRVVEGHAGLAATAGARRRFACFASWGFDARVVHHTSAALKRRLRSASYVVTAIGEIARLGTTGVPGRMRFDGAERRTMRGTSVVVSKIRNYAGFDAFETGVERPDLEALVAPSDAPWNLKGLYLSIAVRGWTRRRCRSVGCIRPVGTFSEARWRSVRPTHVQLDGESVEMGDTSRLRVGIDPVRQRYLLPAR